MKLNPPRLSTWVKWIGTGLLLIFLIVNPLINPRPVSAATASTQITASGDDVNEDGSTFTTTDPTIWFGTGSSTSASFTGLRYANIAIPAGSTITSAKFDLLSTQIQWIRVSMSIAGDLSVNSPTFTSDNRPSQRALTNNKVNSRSNVLWIPGTWYTLDEMAPIVQEIINQPGWQSGNSLSFILKGTGSAFGRKYFQSWDGSNSNAPKLEITFSSSTATQPTATLANTATATPTLTRTPTGILASPTGTLAPSTTTAPSATAFKPAATATPTATTIPAASSTPQSTLNPASISMQAFKIGAGNTDVIPHQVVRAGNDVLYTFASKGDSSPLLYATWAGSAGLPGSSSSFTGFAQINDSANLISVDAAYDGANTIHVFTNGLDGQIKDHPFDIPTNSFKTAIVIDTNGGTLSGFYGGTSGVSALFDRSSQLHVAYWTSSNHILYRAYTESTSTGALTLAAGPTQLDSSGSANHPVLAVSPLDGSITAAWISQASSPTQILTRNRTSGSWGAVISASAAPVWTSTSGGINIDQGPSLIITPDGVRHLAYIEDWRLTKPYDYGRVHESTSSGSSWVDQYTGWYSHDPALATNNAGSVYIIGHGYPLNASCTSVDVMCLAARNADGTWGAQVVLISPQGSQSFDSSPSVKWSVVGFNRPESIEFVFNDSGSGGLSNPVLYYGRINTGAVPNPTATQPPAPSKTPTPNPTPTPTASASQPPTATPAPTVVSQGGQPTYIQSMLAYSTNFTSSQAGVMPNAVGGGHAMVVAVSAYSNGIGDIASVSDSAGNVYTRAVQSPAPASGNHGLSIWVALNVKSTAGLIVTAAAPNGNPEYISLAAHEYSGVASANALDQTTSAQGSGLAAISGSTGTTAQANELLFGAFLHEQDQASSPTVATPAAGVNLRQALLDGSYEALVSEDLTVNQIGTYIAGLIWNKTAVWIGAAITLKGN